MALQKYKGKLIDPEEIEYWRERFIKRDKSYIRDCKKLEQAIKKELLQAKKEIKKEISAFYANLNEVNLTEAEKNRLEITIQAINKELDRMFQAEENLLTQAMIDKYKQTYKELCADLGVNFIDIPTLNILEVLSQEWSGTNYKKIIWGKHRYQIARELEIELKRGLVRGDSLQDISRHIMKKIDKGWYNTMRLVRTEMSWVINEASRKNYEDNGITHYMFMAFIDERTSTVCKDWNGEIVAVKDGRAGYNLPPLHPHCRSTTIPLTDREAK